MLVAALASAALAWLAPHPGLALWGVSLACELLLVVALTLFCALTFAQVMPAVSFVAAFYLLARMIGAIRLIAGSDLLPQRRGLGASLISVTYGVGGAIGAILASHLVASFGWRTAFLVVGLIGAADMLLQLCWIHDRRHGKSAPRAGSIAWFARMDSVPPSSSSPASRRTRTPRSWN